MIKLGFIGVGGMGMGQAASFAQLEDCQIVAGADTSESALARFQDKYPQAKPYTTYKKLLRDTNVDAVVVSVPTYYHRDICIAAMESGRPVLTEKPMGRSVEHCRQMNEVAEQTDQLLMVAHCRRYDADWGTFAKIVQTGRLGKPVLWRHVAAGPGPGKPWFVDDKLGGGPLMDGAVHNYDFGNYLFGDPQSVIASSIKLTPATAIDTGTAVVRWQSGNQLMLSWSWGVAPGGNIIDVLGPEGTLKWGPGEFASAELDTQGHGYYHVIANGEGEPKLFKFQKKNMYVAQAQHFLDCIEGKTECMTPGTEAIKAVAIAEAILQAAPDGGTAEVKWE